MFGPLCSKLFFTWHRENLLTGNPTSLRKSHNLFQYIIIRSKEKNEMHLRN